MKETGLMFYSAAMLDGLCKNGLVQEAMKLFRLMCEKGAIYTAVLDAFCQS
jgi:pentatricopeptide repeat protein